MTASDLILGALALLPIHADSAWIPMDRVSLSLTHLKLDLAIDYDEERLAGTAELTLENASGEGVRLVPLLLYRLMTVTEVTDQGGSALAFTQDVVLFQDLPKQQANHISIMLDTAIEPGARRTLRITYGGHLAGYAETGMRYIQDHIDRSFTILREDAFAFPMLGVPSWDQNRKAPRPAFTFAVHITVPESLVVATGGVETGRVTSDGRTTFGYRSMLPVDFVNIAIAPYQVHRGKDLRVFAFPEDSAGAHRVVGRIEQAMALLEGWFGPHASNTALAVIEIPEGYGSQASLAAGIIQTRDAFQDSTEHRQLYHELSHLWNVPDLDAPSPRWNEGLASFLERRLAEELDAWTGMSASVEGAATAVLERFEKHPSYRHVPLADYGRAGLTDLSYPVGMLMFYTLHRLIGHEAFTAAIRGYLERYRGTGGTTRDFVAFVEGSTDRQLGTFFDDWVFSTTWVTRRISAGSMNGLVELYQSGVPSN